MAKEAVKSNDYPETGIRVTSVPRSPHEVESAYHFMDGDMAKAYQVLKSGIEKEPEIDSLWLMKLDALRILGDREKFEDSSMLYAEKFGIMPPSWRDIESVDTTTIEDDSKKDVKINPVAFIKANISEYVDLMMSANGGSIVINLSNVSNTDRDGIVNFNIGLRNAIAAGSTVKLQNVDRFIKSIVENSIKIGKNFRDLWFLTFLIMKIQDMSEAFDEFSMQFVEAFGESPPDWETMLTSIKPTNVQKKTSNANKVDPIKDAIALSSDLSQIQDSDVDKLLTMAKTGKLILDMRSCRKISLSAATKLSNMIDAAEKTIVMVGANYMIRSALHCANFSLLLNLNHKES